MRPPSEPLDTLLLLWGVRPEAGAIPLHARPGQPNGRIFPRLAAVVKQRAGGAGLAGVVESVADAPRAGSLCAHAAAVELCRLRGRPEGRAIEVRIRGASAASCRLEDLGWRRVQWGGHCQRRHGGEHHVAVRELRPQKGQEHEFGKARTTTTGWIASSTPIPTLTALGRPGRQRPVWFCPAPRGVLSHFTGAD